MHWGLAVSQTLYMYDLSSHNSLKKKRRWWSLVQHEESKVFWGRVICPMKSIQSPAFESEFFTIPTRSTQTQWSHDSSYKMNAGHPWSKLLSTAPRPFLIFSEITVQLYDPLFPYTIPTSTPSICRHPNKQFLCHIPCLNSPTSPLLSHKLCSVPQACFKWTSSLWSLPTRVLWQLCSLGFQRLSFNSSHRFPP